MHWDRSVSEENDISSGSNRKSSPKKMKRAENGSKFKRIIAASSSEDTENECLSTNPIFCCVSSQCTGKKFRVQTVWHIKLMADVNNKSVQCLNQSMNSLLIDFSFQFERTLNSDQNKQLVAAFTEYYDNNGNYESFRDTLFQIFNGADDAASLTGMMLFVKCEHQSKFDEDIRNKYK